MSFIKENWTFFKRAPRKTRWCLIGLSCLAVAAVIGAGCFTHRILTVRTSGQIETEKLAFEQELEAKKRALLDVPEYTYAYELKDVSIPLVDRGATRVAYAQFTLVLDCPNEKAKRTMELNRAKLLDVIFEVASQFYVEDFEGPSGIKSFKSSLLGAYDKKFGKTSPRSVVFKNWFVG